MYYRVLGEIVGGDIHVFLDAIPDLESARRGLSELVGAIVVEVANHESAWQTVHVEADNAEEDRVTVVTYAEDKGNQVMHLSITEEARA